MDPKRGPRLPYEILAGIIEYAVHADNLFENKTQRKGCLDRLCRVNVFFLETTRRERYRTVLIDESREVAVGRCTFLAKDRIAKCIREIHISDRALCPVEVLREFWLNRDRRSYMGQRIPSNLYYDSFPFLDALSKLLDFTKNLVGIQVEMTSPDKHIFKEASITARLENLLIRFVVLSIAGRNLPRFTLLSFKNASVDRLKNFHELLLASPSAFVKAQIKTLNINYDATPDHWLSKVSGEVDGPDPFGLWGTIAKALNNLNNLNVNIKTTFPTCLLELSKLPLRTIKLQGIHICDPWLTKMSISGEGSSSLRELFVFFPHLEKLSLEDVHLDSHRKPPSIGFGFAPDAWSDVFRTWLAQANFPPKALYLHRLGYGKNRYDKLVHGEHCQLEMIKIYGLPAICTDDFKDLIALRDVIKTAQRRGCRVTSHSPKIWFCFHGELRNSPDWLEARERFTGFIEVDV